MKNYPNHVTCPYNALHRFLNKEDLVPHILNCPNRALGKTWTSSKPTKHGDLTDQPYHYENHSKEDDEDWESEYLK